MTKESKIIPIGNSDFRDVLKKDQYYVDKTLLVKEILDSGSVVSLITRPRRFGKTMNLSMLQNFFEAPLPDINKPAILRASSGKNKKNLFENLAIWKQGKKYTDHYAKYPVIFFSLKDAKAEKWQSCYELLEVVIARLYKNHQYILHSGSLNKMETRDFENILNREASDTTLKASLFNLTDYLYHYYDKKVIVLIDEYDSPVHEAFEHRFYTEIISFLRSFLGSGLKDNIYIEKVIITGILRVTKENIFSDLNNPEIATLLSNAYSDKFGFTEEEVIQFLINFNLEDKFPEVRKWYDGYVIGNTNGMFNPWSIINYISKHQEGFQPYWINTSGNVLVNHLLAQSGEIVKNELESLIDNKPIRKKINSHIIFSDLTQKSESLWSLLFFSGYLKVTENVRPGSGDEDVFYQLTIPNLEIRITYKRFISEWFTNYYSDHEINILCRSFLSGELDNLQILLQKFVKNSMSFFDVSGEEPEKVYHAFVLGLLIHIRSTHRVKSNAESGLDRYDIMLIPKDDSKTGAIIEFKKVYRKVLKENLETACDSALRQIDEKDYASELEELGVVIIYKYGIAFEGKEVLVKMG